MLLADENIPIQIIESLRESKLDVVSIFEEYRGYSDKEIINLAKKPPKIILTEDKDFGDLVFAYNQKGVSVILLRYHFLDLELITTILINFIKNNQIETSNFIIMTTKNIRIRKID